MAQILLVEPDTVLAKTYAAALMKRGHHILRAQDAQSAINACDAVTPDCIILEVLLPHHNGIEFIYELRSHADWHDIPVIINSQLPLERLELDTATMQQLAIRSYCYKPDTSLSVLDELVDSITKVTEP